MSKERVWLDIDKTLWSDAVNNRTAFSNADWTHYVQSSSLWLFIFQAKQEKIDAQDHCGRHSDISDDDLCDNDDENWETVDESGSSSSDGSDTISCQQQKINSDKLSKVKAKRPVNGRKRRIKLLSSSQKLDRSLQKVENSPELLTGPQLIDLFQSIPLRHRLNEDHTVVGMVCGRFVY